MEGYARINPSHEDFDDLNIERRFSVGGRQLDIKERNQELEERRLLSQKVKLDDGTYGHLFSTSEGDNVIRWHCHMCDIYVVGFPNLHLHIKGKKHQQKLLLPSHPKAHFPRIEREELDDDFPQLAPGEPVPPGFEDKVRRVTQIQAELDKVTTKPLIGLEYLLELTDELGNTEPKYVCLLCEKKGERHVVLGHLTSFEHYNKYIGMYFPTASRAMASDFPKTKDGKKAMSLVLTNICRAIEKLHGRLQPMAVDKHTFEAKKNKYLAQIIGAHHFSEKPGETFVELVDKSILASVQSPTDLHGSRDDKAKDAGSITFNKAKVTAAQLRTRDIESNYEQETPVSAANKSLKRVAKQEDTTHKRSDDVDAENIPKRSLSSVSSRSISRSRSRSKSRSRKKARGRSRSYSPFSRGAHSSSYRLESSRSYLRRNSGRRSPLGSLPYSRSRNRRSKSRSRSRSRSRPRQRIRSRSKSPVRSHHHKKETPRSSPSRRRSPKEDTLAIEKGKWDTFRHEVDKIDREADKLLKFHEQNPEKHPLYPEEWKKFWSIRYKELQAEGKDPNKHNFKPEWIEFWNKRMLFLHKEDLKNKKEQLKKQLGLPKEEPLPVTTVKKKAPLHVNKDVVATSTGTPNNTVTENEKTQLKSSRLTGNTVKNIRSSHSPVKEESKDKESDVKLKLKEKLKLLREESAREDSEEVMIIEREADIKPQRVENRKPEREENRKSEREENRKSEREENRKSEREENRKHEREENRKHEREENRKSEREENRKPGVSKKANVSRKPDVIKNSDEAEIVPILRLLTAMESQLGSLGPKINNLMGKALSLEKIQSHSADSLLTVPENIVLFETVKEKLKGQLMAGIVEKNMLSATKTCLDMLVSALKKIDEKNVKTAPILKTSVDFMKPIVENVVENVPVVEPKPVAVPEINPLDKAAIAQQIAAALVAQGKTDVTQEELEQLINIFTGMAQASKGSGSIISTAQFVAMQQQQQQQPQQQQQQQQQMIGASNFMNPQNPAVMMPNISTTSKEPATALQQLLSVVTSKASSSYTVSPSVHSKDNVSGLQLLQNAYDEPRNSPVTNSVIRGDKQHTGNISVDQKKQIASGNDNRTGKEISYLSEVELQTLLQNFKDLSAHEQQCLITYLRKLEENDPARVEQLRKYVVIEAPVKKSPLNVATKPTASPVDRFQRRRPLSPFSQRLYSSNPVGENKETKKPTNEKETENKNTGDDSDEEYTYEEIYAAASKKVKESEEAKAKEKELEKERGPVKRSESSGSVSSKNDDPASLLKQTKAMIANLMGQLPAKYPNKQSAVPSPTDTQVLKSAMKPDNSQSTSANANVNKIYPITAQSYGGKYTSGQPIRTYNSGQPTRTYDSSQSTRIYDSGQSTQHYPAGDTSNNLPSTQQQYSNYQQSDYSAPYGTPQGADFSNTVQYQSSYGSDYSNSYQNQPAVTPSQDYNYGVPPQNTYSGDDYNQYGQTTLPEQRTDYYPYQGQNRTYY